MSEIRDLGYLKWRDPLAWMENMKGKRWDTLIKKENDYYNELVSQVKKETRQMENEIISAQQYSKLSFKIGCGTIDIELLPNEQFSWKWEWEKKGKIAYDIDVQANIVWYIKSKDENDYTNTLVCEDSTGKVIWTKRNVSDNLAVIDDLCYYIKVADYFRTIEICVCNSQTGGQEKVIYKEPDEIRDLYFTKGAHKALYFRSYETLHSRLYKINGIHCEQLAKQSRFQMALGESVYGDCILTRKSHYDKWQAKGKPIDKWIFPEEEPLWINIQSGLVLTLYEGSYTIWYCCNKKPITVFKVKVGSITQNIWCIWEETLTQSFIVKTPFETPYIINIIHNKVYKDTLQVERPITFNELDVRKYHSVSKDGTRVPYIVIKEKGIAKAQIPKAQLIYVYGAYGSSTPIDWPYQVWYPLLKRKWAIVFALVRGGGDSDAAWANIARTTNRHVSVDDFESVIRDSQKKLKLGADKTVIYGRSAGGLPVGAIVARFPHGQLVGAAFTEVPFVDILRDTSNPDLPLTVGEFHEFGNPLDNILNFKELLSVSPINTLTDEGAPGVFVISHVGLLDKQVFAYESFKWISKLRGCEKNANGKNANGKYVTIERKEAHRYRPQKMPRFRGTDFAILDSWVDRKLIY